MKTSRILLLLAAATVMASCQKNELNNVLPSDNSVISAVIDEDNTKTTLNGVKVCWASGDAIAINKKKYSATPDATDAGKATFTLVSTNPFIPVTPPTDAPFCAYYPFDANRTTTKGQFILPSTQTYGLDNNIATISPMYAVSESLDETFHFKNVCGLITLDLKGTGTVSDITVSANEFLAGILTNIAISESGVLTYSAIEDDGYYASKSVSLGCGKAATLSTETARRFYIALPEGDFTGVKIAVTTDLGTMEIPASKTVSIKKNNIYHLPEMTVKPNPITFDFELTDLTHNSVSCKTTPSNSNTYYYTGRISKDDLELYGNLETYASAMMAYYLDGHSAAEILDELMDKGPTEYGYILDPETEYNVFAFAVDNQCNIISGISSMSFKSLELPYAKAAYADYLGKWIVGGRTVVISEKVSGESYTVNGLTYTALYNKDASIEAIYDDKDGCLTISEQKFGEASHPSYGLVFEYLSGFFSYDSESIPAYPFNTTEPSILLKAWKTKTGGYIWENGYCKYDNFSNIGTCWVIQEGEYEGKGNWSPGISLPQTAEKAPEMEEGYAKWLGTWQTANGRYITIDEAITNQTFSGTFDEDLADANIVIPYDDGKIQLCSQFLKYGSSSYGNIAIFLCGCEWYNNKWSLIPDEYLICTAELSDGGNSFSFSKGTYEDTYEVGAITYGALIIDGDYAGYTLSYTDITPLELPATFTKIQPVKSAKKAHIGNTVLGRKTIVNNFKVSNLPDNQETFAPAFPEEGLKIKKASAKNIRF